MKETLIFILKNILGEKIDFQIQEVKDDAGVLNFIIDTSDEFKPKIIGKGGRTISAIYQLLNIQAKKENTRIHLKIKD